MPIRIGGPAPRTLNLTLVSEGQKASFLQALSPGQRLQAQVLDQGPEGRWILDVQGQKLLAESRLPLIKGQVVSARVESLGPPVVLSVVESEADLEAALSRALKDLSLEDDPAGRAVLGRMVGRQLVLDRPMVQQLRDALTRTGVDVSDRAAADRTIDGLILLISRSIPINPQTLAAALASPAPNELGALLGNLLDLIRGLARGPQTAGDADLRSSEQALRGLIASADGLSDAELKRLVQNLGTGLEARLRALAEGAEGSGAARQLAQHDLKAALLRLAAGLQAVGEDADQMRAFLRGRAGEVLHRIEHLQFLNLPARQDPDPFLYLQLPLRFGEELTTMDLRVFYSERQGRRRIDPDNVRLVVRLSLTHLGQVEIDLRAVNRILDCRIDVEGVAQQSLFRDAQEDLKAALEGCGYHVRKVACEIRAVEPDAGDSEKGQAKRLGLDVRA